MRYLFCSSILPDCLHPLIGLALELTQRGHRAAFATGPAADGVLRRAGLQRIAHESTDANSFRLQPYPIAQVVAIDVDHIAHAIRTWAPDVMVTNEFTLASAIIREREGIPLVVMGTPAYLWPRWAVARSIDEVRTHFGLPAAAPTPAEYPLRGDLFLLRSVPELGYEVAQMPPEVRFAGSCRWEPGEASMTDRCVLDGAISQREGRLLYVQHRYTAEEPDYWAALVQATEALPVTVFASLARMDNTAAAHPPRFVVRESMPAGVVLPHADLALAGSRSLVALDAATHGVPCLLVRASNDEATELAERLEHAGCVRQIAARGLAPVALREAIEDALHDDHLRTRARAVGAAFARLDGFGAAATQVEHMHS